MYETCDMSTGASCSVKLHDGRNVVLLFTDEGMSEPLAWGFADVRDWRRFVKMVRRFDDALGELAPRTRGREAK